MRLTCCAVVARGVVPDLKEDMIEWDGIGEIGNCVFEGEVSGSVGDGLGNQISEGMGWDESVFSLCSRDRLWLHLPDKTIGSR